MKPTVRIVFIVLLFLLILIDAICMSPSPLPPEYSTMISVDKPNKIENAISNVVVDLGKRDFVPVELEVRWHPASKTYVIHIGGIDRTNLSKYEP